LTPKNRNTQCISVPGEAITPIPVVFMGDKRLFFAKDFNLTYKNNIQCGVAEVNITGKGIYGGRKLVTFNIERINSEN
jgi:hypothetical protein